MPLWAGIASLVAKLHGAPMTSKKVLSAALARARARGVDISSVEAGACIAPLCSFKW